MKKKKANSSVARENAERSERSDLKYHNKRQWLVKYKDLSGRKFNFQLCFKMFFWPYSHFCLPQYFSALRSKTPLKNCLHSLSWHLHFPSSLENTHIKLLSSPLHAIALSKSQRCPDGTLNSKSSPSLTSQRHLLATLLETALNHFFKCLLSNTFRLTQRLQK